MNGLRCLQQLAADTGGITLSASDIARAEGFDVEATRELLDELGRAGFVEAAEDIGGGYRLSRPASAIRVSDVWSTFVRSAGPGRWRRGLTLDQLMDWEASLFDDAAAEGA